MSNKRAVVTGAFGFLGRNVCKVFSDNGYSITGLGHGTWLRSEWQKWGLSEWHPCEITYHNLLAYAHKPDVIIHCAGSGSVENSMISPFQDFERTVYPSITILEYLRLNSPETSFFYPSSAAVYGTTKRLPIKESTVLNPISPYGLHKKIVEEICTMYGRYFLIPIVIVRFFSLYGPPLHKQLLWDACQKMKEGNYSFYGTGMEVRDWLYVRDAAELLLTLSPHASSDTMIVNGGTGVGTTVKDILVMIAEFSGNSVSPTFSHERKPGDPVGYIADISKIKRFGWKPKMTLENGIKEYLNWFKSGDL